MTVAQIIGLIVVLVVTALGAFFILRKSKKHDLAKWILLFIFLSIALTWIFHYGYYQGAEFNDYGINRQGLSDIPNLLYYSINFAGDKIIFLLALGVFYAVLGKCKGYKKLVTSIAEKFKGKEIIFALVASLLVTAMTAIFTQTFIVLIFVPFLVSVLLNMKLDKLTAFSTTFGSIIIGTLGTIYGGEGFYWFNYYTQSSVKTAILYRLIVLVVAYILFNFFNVLHIKDTLKNKNTNELEADPYKIENVDKKAKSWPIVTLFIILFAILVLGYVGWESSFGISIFSKFHTWLLGLKIKDFEVFSAILGTLAKDAAFGAWNLFHASLLLTILSLVFALVGRVKLNEFIESYAEGAKVMSKPLALYMGTYMVMVAAYMSPFIPTITNTIFTHFSKFNPFLVAGDAFISSVFHVDFGFTGYIVASYFTKTLLLPS